MVGCAAFSLIKKAAAAANTGAMRYEKHSAIIFAIPIPIGCENKALQRSHRFTGR
jgi:hypothetical protein